MLNLITSIATALAAIAACWAAFEARRSAQIASRYNEAEIFANLLDEYANPEMHDAINALLDWELDHEPILDKIRNSEAPFEDRNLNMAPTVGDWQLITKHRRRIYYFFQRAYIYWKDGLLTNTTMQRLTELTAYPLLQRIVMPLTRVVYEVEDEAMVVTKVGLKDRIQWIEELAASFPTRA